jgi:hypothetical protein
MSIPQTFKEDIKNWIENEIKIEKAKKAIKHIKNKQDGISVRIFNYVDKNNLKNKNLKFKNNLLKCQSVNKTDLLTKKIISERLKEFLKDRCDDPDTKTKDAVQTLYNQRRRMEICFSECFDNDELAIEAVEFIFSNRQNKTTNKIKRKVETEQMVI